MKIKFFTEKGVLDLSNINISTQEENSKLSDKNFSKFTFPFEVYIDDDFIKTFGDYLSYENWEIKKEIPGKLFFEGRVQDAKLDIISIEGEILTGQIDFGLDDIPNFDKKLKDLPLEKFDVDDIHTYAVEVCKKAYPETNFNFPRMHTDKYQPTQKMWDAFEGYYNHTIGQGDSLAFVKNIPPTEQNEWNPDNVNIIHPTPHLLYLLKTGFSDAGYTLTGDILNDELILKSWVFSGTQYFRNKYLQSIKEEVKLKSWVHKDEWEEEIGNRNDPNHQIIYHTDYIYKTKAYHLKKGKYKIEVDVLLSTLKQDRLEFYLYDGNNNRLFEGHKSKSGFITLSEDKNILLETRVEFHHNINPENDNTDDETILTLKVFSQEAYTPEENDNVNEIIELKVVDNENHIDLRRAVPEMTFGELVGIVQNWLNYGLSISDQTIYMNRINDESIPTPKDFRTYEVERPKRTLQKQKSFLIKFADLDKGEKLNSILFNSKGYTINGKEEKDTNIIEINGYPMPLRRAKKQHPETAHILKDSDNTLAIVCYTGLKEGRNDAQPTDDFLFPALLKYWDKWIPQRISSTQYEWKFLTSTQEFRNYSVRDYLFAYNNLHIIRSINKDIVAPNTYEVTIVTEAISRTLIEKD